MNAKATHLINLLDGKCQFLIPIYQRPYSWTEKQCCQLFDDIVRIAADTDLPAHFVGSVVYVERGLYQVTAVPELLVIDGQQRLTTFSLIVEALARVLEQSTDAGAEITPRKLRNYCLFNSDEDRDKRFKLVLSRDDDATYKALIQQKDLPDNPSRRIVENFEYFVDRIEDCEMSVADLYVGLSKLLVVGVALDRTHDNAQLIFESLNSTGLDLSQADLVRNYVLMGLESEHQTGLYEDHWLPMERILTGGDRDNEFDWFLRAWLTIRTFEVNKRERGYEVFKRYRQEHATRSIDELVAELHRFAHHYAHIALGQETEDRFKPIWSGLQALRIDAPLPFLMYVRDEYEAGRLSLDDAVAIAALVESWLVRRMVCEIPSNVLSKTFATLLRNLDEDALLESFSAWLLCRTGSQRFPSDAEFSQAFASRNFYEFKGRQYCLTRLENQGRKELVEMGQYTVEHVLPQNEDLSEEWRALLGDDWQSIQERLLHTIGNLTLTGYNPELSDRPFLEKRDMEGGFRDTPIRLSRAIAQADTWTEESIQQRGLELADEALGIWSTPEVAEDVLAAYREKMLTRTKRGPKRSLEHFEISPEIRALYDRFAAGAVEQGLERTIWSYGVLFDPPGGYVGYSTVIVRFLQRWLRIRLAVPLDELENPPSNASSFRTRSGDLLTRVNATTDEDIDVCLELLAQVLARDPELVGSDDLDDEDEA